MAKAKQEENTGANSGSQQGRAVVLPNGQRRIDYIREQFYEKGVKRGDIARALTEMTGKQVPYQIVFAATKEKPEDYKKRQEEAAKAAKEASAQAS